MDIFINRYGNRVVVRIAAFSVDPRFDLSNSRTPTDPNVRFDIVGQASTVGDIDPVVKKAKQQIHWEEGIFIRFQDTSSGQWFNKVDPTTGWLHY